jgi:hypothetical protein
MNLMFETEEIDLRPQNCFLKNYNKTKRLLYKIYIISRSHEKIMNVLTLD